MLGMGIPALTPSTGRSQLGTTIIPSARQPDLNDGGTVYQANFTTWPNRGDPDYQNWLHNDMKNVAYFFNFPLFDKIVDAGGLK